MNEQIDQSDYFTNPGLYRKTHTPSQEPPPLGPGFIFP